MKVYKNVSEFVSAKQVFCGIDVDKNYWVLCFICDGEVVEECRMLAIYKNLSAHLQKHYSKSREIKLVYEAGFSGFGLYRNLKNDGYNCRITPPALLPQDGSKVKTDRVDARKLAFYLSANLLKSIWVPPTWIEADRAVCRRRSQLVIHQTRCKNEIHAFLKLRNLKKPEEIQTNWSRAHLNWLSSLDFEEKSDAFVFEQLIDRVC